MEYSQREPHFLKQNPLTWYLENKRERVTENKNWEVGRSRRERKKKCLCRSCLEGSVLWHFLCSPWEEPRRSSWAARQALLSQELSAVQGLQLPFSVVAASRTIISKLSKKLLLYHILPLMMRASWKLTEEQIHHRISGQENRLFKHSPQ